MIVYYIKYNKVQNVGDLKVMKNGESFIRVFNKTLSGQFVLNNGKYSYIWVDYNDELAVRYKKNIEVNGMGIFKSSSKNKTTTNQRISLDLSNYNDREKYKKFIGFSPEKSSKLKVNLTMSR